MRNGPEGAKSSVLDDRTAAPADVSPTALESITVVTVSDIEGSAAACLAWLPADALERLVGYVTPSAIRQRRLDERDALYRTLAAGLPHLHGRLLADAIAKEVSQYRTGRWRFERDRPAPADPRRALMHRLLTLDRKCLGAERLRVVLSGLNSADFLTQKPRHDPDTGHHGVEDETVEIAIARTHGVGTCG